MSDIVSVYYCDCDLSSYRTIWYHPSPWSEHCVYGQAEFTGLAAW